jgi:O-antigen/teichoic acid export membrane protein
MINTKISLLNNSIANYFERALVIVLTFFITPLYFSHLGHEQFGLFGFYQVIYAILALLEFGMNPALGRQVSLAKGSGKYAELYRVIKSFEKIFLLLSIVLFIFAFKDFLSSEWINSKNLEHNYISNCIVYMGLIISVNFYSSLYISGLSNWEDQVFLNIIKSVSTLLKFLGGYMLIAYIANSIIYFFMFQLLISILEMIFLILRFKRVLPISRFQKSIFYFNFQTVKKLMPFALSISYLSILWIIVIQADKIVLSKILTLTEFGYLTLIFLLTKTINEISTPIAKAIRPRLTYYYGQNNLNEFIKLYSNSSQYVTLLAFSLGVIMGLFSKEIIYIWTRDEALSLWASDILIWFALGNSLLAIQAFQTYLQHSFGNLKLLIQVATINAFIQIPLLIYFSYFYGVKGAALSWFCLRLIFFVFWSAVIHTKYLKNFHWKWLLTKIIPIVTIICFMGMLFKSIIEINYIDKPLISIIQLAIIFLSTVIFSSLPIQKIQFFIKRIINKYV